MLATLRKNLKNFVSICYYGFTFLLTGNSNGLETIMRCSKIVSMTSQKKSEHSLSESKSTSSTSSQSLTTTQLALAPSSKIEDQEKCRIHSIEIKTVEIPN